MTCSGMSRRRSGPSVQKAVQEVRFQNLGLYFRKKRPLDSRTRTTTTARFDLKFFRVLSKIDTPELFIVLFFTKKVSDVIGFEGG